MVEEDDEYADVRGVAREGMFNIMRAWVSHKLESEDDFEKVAYECLAIMKEVNQTPGAAFIFVAELARVCVEIIAQYMSALNEELPSREDLMNEISVLECEYIEESVLAEWEDEHKD
jgi:hypothetical protein